MEFVSGFRGIGAKSLTKTVANTSIRTLIVDDEPIARRVLEEELEDHPDVEVVGEARHGEEALDLIARLKPDLVLLDLQMPGMGGFEVIRRLAGARLPIVIIVTTSVSQPPSVNFSIVVIMRIVRQRIRPVS